MEKSIKILDCTLRDGGYVIDWMFGRKNILSVINNLSKAGIDFIECGFLKECQSNSEQTFFNSISDLEDLIPDNTQCTLMVNFGEYGISNFSKNKNKNIKIRVAFKKHNQSQALEYIENLINLGWEVFANPMSTNTYTEKELHILIKEINRIKPCGICIVDTLGNMYEKQVEEIFEIINNILEKNIALGFHSHNSLQLSFSNTKALLKMCIDRDLIIDSCLYGMGRGSGNLCTELITKYLNDNYGKDYKLLPLVKAIDENIKPFYETAKWGYSTPYYLAAIHGCHPNYAAELVKFNLPDEQIDKLLSQISDGKKTTFDKGVINELISGNNYIKQMMPFN